MPHIVFKKCCLDPILRPWLEASQFPFLSSQLSLHPQSLPSGSHTPDHPTATLIAQGQVVGELLCLRAWWNYSNHSILSLLALPCLFFPSEATIYYYSIILRDLPKVPTSLSHDPPWCFPEWPCMACCVLDRELWVQQHFKIISNFSVLVCVWPHPTLPQVLW